MLDLNKPYTAPQVFDVLERMEASLQRLYPHYASRIRALIDEAYDAIERGIDLLPERISTDESLLPRPLLQICSLRIEGVARTLRRSMLELEAAQNPCMN